MSLYFKYLAQQQVNTWQHTDKHCLLVVMDTSLIRSVWSADHTNTVLKPHPLHDVRCFIGPYEIGCISNGGFTDSDVWFYWCLHLFQTIWYQEPHVLYISDVNVGCVDTDVERFQIAVCGSKKTRTMPVFQACSLCVSLAWYYLHTHAQNLACVWIGCYHYKCSTLVWQDLPELFNN